MTAPTEPLKLTPAELEEAAAAVEDLYRWNDAPTPHLVGKLRRLAQCAVEEAEPAGARDDAAELRAACEAAKSALTALNRVQMYGSADMVRDRAKRALDLIDAALAATEGSESC